MPDEATEADEAGDAAPSILVVIAGAPEDAGKGPKVHQVSIARTDTSALGNPFVAPRLRDAVEANELQRQATAAHAEWLRMLSVPAGRVSDGPDGDAVILNGEGLPFDPRIAPRTGAWKRMTGQQQVDAVRGALRERGDKTTLRLVGGRDGGDAALCHGGALGRAGLISRSVDAHPLVLRPRAP